MLTTITNLRNTIITADVIAHSRLWYSPTEDHRGELIKDILLNSHQIKLNTNTPTCLPPNQTQQPTSQDIITASADFHDCTSWQTIHSLTSDHLPLLTTLSIHHKVKTTHSHFTKTITNYQKANWISFNNMLRISSADPTAQIFMRATKHLIKAILDAQRLFIPKGNHNSSNHTHLPMHIRKLMHHSRSDPQIITLNNHINKQIHEHKTSTWKQHLDKIDHKHNPHSLWGTTAKLSDKKPPIQQNRNIHFGTKTAIIDIDKAKAFNKQFSSVTPYSTNKINRHIDHTIKNLPMQEIQLTITQVQLAISNSTTTIPLDLMA